MIPKPVHEITIQDFQQLIDDNAVETKTLEFKRDFYRLNIQDQKTKDEAKTELLKDISAFANTNGGDLIIGVDEEAGAAIKIVGFTCDDPDALFRQIKQLTDSWIEPRIDLSYKSIPTGIDQIVMLIRVESSVNGPHRVTFKQHNQFYLRGFGSISTMDINELRNAFLFSQSLSDKIRRFRHDRFEAIIRDSNLPQPTRFRESFLLVHIIPEQAFTSSHQLSAQEFKTSASRMRLLNNSRPECRLNLDGYLLSHSPEVQGPAEWSFTQFYKNGIVEMYCSGMRIEYPNRHKSTTEYIVNEHTLHSVVSVSHDNLEVVWNLGVRSTSWMFVSLGFMTETMVDNRNQFPFDPSIRIDRNHLEIQEVMIPASLSTPPSSLDIGKAAKPIYDSIWNSSGLPKCTFYDESGEFIPW